MDFIGGADGAFEPGHDLRGEFETEIHALGANVKDQVARCRNSMAGTRTNFMEWMEFGWTWQAEEAVPGIGTEAHDAGKSAIEGAKTHAAKKRRKISAEGKDRNTILVTGIDSHNEKNRDLGKWRGDELRES